MCRELRRAHSVRLKIIYVFKQGVITDMAGKVLVVDDEKIIVKGIKFSLIQDYSVVDCAYDGEEALNMAKNNDYDIILLDIMLPKMNGLEVCQQIREFSNVPIIMLTAKGDDMDKIMGLEYGADDYITKPFNIKEVILRINNLLKRAYDNPSKIQIDGYDIDLEKRRVFYNNNEIILTTKEYDLLVYFLNNKGLAISREQVLSKVWDENYFGSDRVVDDTLRRLRKKMPEINIRTIYGFGYRLD